MKAQAILVGLIMVIVMGCGPHFNMHAKPDIYDQQEQDKRVEKERVTPYVPADVKPPETSPATPAPPAAKPLGDMMTINVPNWPVVGYGVDGAIIILLVREPAKFPIPGAFTFQNKDGSVITMPMVKPDSEKGKTK